ncbi:MAG: hypothetical protein BWY66_02251 [bacterium ADurb.Bin374]|nr:MAG: hypothetical protein BWY66_02251 [bacterium ADurb.Bin374]
MSSSELTASFTPHLTRMNAGTAAQMPPANAPAPNIAAMPSQPGRCCPTPRPTQVAATAPNRSWPSAPMFQMRARKQIARPAPIRVSGTAFVRVSLKPYQLPKEPAAIFVIAVTGETPITRKSRHPSDRPARMESTIVVPTRTDDGWESASRRHFDVNIATPRSWQARRP